MDAELVGLIPAGGRATRIAPLPCSKELYPVGFHPAADGTLRPKVVSQYLLEKLQLAGAQRAFFILRPGKWDIPAYYGDGGGLGLPLGYLIMDLPYGAPYTLDQAYPFVQRATVLFGFPDILFEPQDAFVQLLERRSATGADVVLGIMPHDDPRTSDMVGCDAGGRVQQIAVKDPGTTLAHVWICAVWGPAFTQFLHTYLAPLKRQDQSQMPELYLGHVIQAAIAHGLVVQSVLFPTPRWIDIGLPANLVRVVRGETRLG